MLRLPSQDSSGEAITPRSKRTAKAKTPQADVENKSFNRDNFVNQLKKAAGQLTPASKSATEPVNKSVNKISRTKNEDDAPVRRSAPKKVTQKKTATRIPKAKTVSVAKLNPTRKKTTSAAVKKEESVSSPIVSSGDTFYKVMMVASECSPFAKTGGLADAVSGLSKALSKAGHEVRIVMPLYAHIDYAAYNLEYVGPACIHMGDREENWVGIHRGRINGRITVWFVDFQRFFGRAGIYNDASGDYSDNAFRYGLLCKAAMQVSKDFGFIPDVMHLHDWPAAPTAAFLKTWDAVNSPLSNTASVLTIHNIGYQGKYHASVMSYFGLSSQFTSDKFEDFGQANLLKAGIHYADMLTTVSPTHAREVLEPEGGHGLTPMLEKRRSDFVGILNGCDIEHWDPENDPLIASTYTADDLEGKAVCKRELQKLFKLPVRDDLPVFSIVSRFAAQKGFILIEDMIEQALEEMEFQLVVVGSGDPEIEAYFRQLAVEWPDRIGLHVGYSEEVAHQAEAGSDFFLMPSLYEPCGLNQIYSLKYGTLPVVRATGGLDDTVENYHEQTGGGTGFKFIQPTGKALYNTMGWAISTWFDRPEHIEQMRKTAMSRQFDWNRSARQYAEVYRRAVANRRSA